MRSWRVRRSDVRWSRTNMTEVAMRVSSSMNQVYAIRQLLAPAIPGNYSSAFPFVSGNCVVITAASKYPAAHK
jgi:hypothetical protein